MNLVKILKYSLVTIIVALFTSCSKDDDDFIFNGLEGLELVTTINNSDHEIEIYTSNGKFQTGYNDVYLQIKKSDGSLVKNATVSWIPMMHMAGMSHSCPTSEITKRPDTESIYNGHIIFQMANNDTEYWALSVNYSIDGVEFTATEKINVIAHSKRVVESFTGVDNKRYVLALIEPSNPKVATNDMKVALYSMVSPTNFQIVDDYKIKIDPRMPGMGNHSSPNNVTLEQGNDKMYHGKLSLTMTGYWKINMQLEDKDAVIQKGEEVTELNEDSSIYFELEF